MNQFSELTYVDERHNWWQRRIIRAVEATVDRRRFEALYQYWRGQIVPEERDIFSRMLSLVDIRLEANRSWPPEGLGSGPTIIVANHPYGIGDGIAALALAESLGRPFKVLINSALLRVPDIRPYALPVNFEETREALSENITMRKQALEFLGQGGTIVVFPAGGVATAPKGLGRAEDLPWKLFTAQLIEKSRATVIPVHFDGQNGWLFHLVSRFSMTLRLSLLVREFAKLSGRTIRASIGEPIHFEDLKAMGDRRQMMTRLREIVFSLAPQQTLHRS